MKENPRKRLSSLRRDMSKDFRFFRKYYFRHPQTVVDASFHEELCELLSGLAAKRGTKLALAAPRGSGKSTLITHDYLIYCICHKVEDYVVLMSSTNDQAKDNLSHIKDELLTNPRLIEDFPEVCEIGTKPKPPRWRGSEIITRNNVKVTALGYDQQIRGRRHKQYRPSLIILDDLEKDADSQTPESYEKLYDWFTRSLLKAGDPHTNVIFMGTIHHYGSLLAQFTNPKSAPGWTKKVYRSVISWPRHPELWEIWAKIYNYHESFGYQDGPEGARAFFEANKEAMLEGTKVLWEQRYDYYSLMVMREEEGHASFDAEMQNEPVNPRDCCFNLEDLHYWDDKYESEQELLAALGEDAEYFGACDPSLGRQSTRGDYSAIITVVRHKKTGTVYVLDADIKDRSPDKTIEDILKYHQRRTYKLFGVESNNFQEFIADQVQKRGNQECIYPQIHKITNTTDKLARIQMLQPLLRSGSIQLCRKHGTLLEELKYCPKARHDDGPDALEMVIQVVKKADRGWGDGMSDIFKKLTPSPDGSNGSRKIIGTFDRYTNTYKRFDDPFGLLRG